MGDNVKKLSNEDKINKKIYHGYNSYLNYKTDRIYFDFGIL